MRGLVLIGMLLTAAPVWAQVHSRPTEPPIVTAENEQWYRQGEPLQVGGDVYYPAGPNIFFNGNTMVRTAHYNGVPLYADTTIEPYSVVLVPVGRGVMQPYERPRRGDLAGTTGSRAPAFPVQARAPRVIPWNPLVKAMTCSRPVILRASLSAASTALVPVGPVNITR